MGSGRRQQVPSADELTPWLSVQAAAWRRQQRGALHQQRRLIVWEAANSGGISDEEEAPGVAAGLRGLLSGARREPLHVRDRTSGILHADRSESWDESNT